MTIPRRTIEDELTPYTLTADEGAAVRTGFDLALRTRYQEAHVAVCDLSEEALRDVLQAVDVFWSFLQFELGGREVGRTIAGRDQGHSTSVDGNDRPTVGDALDALERIVDLNARFAADRLPVRCPRCGHDENIHQYDTASSTTGRLCIECRGWCAPVVVPVGAIEGGAK